jgi:SAM-dependent methyltransferase
MPAPANAAQIDYCNTTAGLTWAAMQAQLDRQIEPLGAQTMEKFAPQPGERVLDIGCGAGVTSLMLADAVGPNGRVTGVDVSQPMLALARSQTQATNIEFIEADAALYPFRPQFDLIFSRFGVMFFADPIAAFANIRKGADRGARLAFICWRAVKENEWASLPYSAAKPLLPEQPSVDPFAPGPFAFADAGRLRDILETSGFSDIKIERFAGAMDLGSVPGHAAFQATSLMGPTARALRNADETPRRRVMDAITQALTEFQTGDESIRLGTACWLVSARA